MLETAEMKVLRKIMDKTLLDYVRNENIRKECKVDNINNWIIEKKRRWKNHIDRMSENRMVRIARDKSLRGR